MFKVKKNTLLLLAAVVWSVAGFNILRLGIIAYTPFVRLINFVLSLLVFSVFQKFIFGKLVTKHTKRIYEYKEERKLFLCFFDIKSFIIMAVMMTGGILIRSYGLAPERFIAVFYTGLGAALFMAGLMFGINYIHAIREKRQKREKTVGEEA